MSLHGLTVMVTRPEPDGPKLCEKIQEKGGEAIYFPTVQILLSDQGDALIRQFARYDIVIFVSKHAVFQSMEKIQKVCSTFPASMQVIAVGLGTASVLKHVHHYPENWNSEGVLALPVLQQVQGKKIAIIRGETGRELIENTLRARGALVDNIIVYRRVMPEIDVQSYQNLVMTRHIDIIVATSNELLKNLVCMLDVRSVPLLVISERMLDFAKKLGFTCLMLAKNASHDAVISELIKQKDQLCQLKKKKS